MDAQMSPVPLESNSDVGSAQDRLNAEQATSMSFIDTSADTSTISIAPSNSPEPGEHSWPHGAKSIPDSNGSPMRAATVPTATRASPNVFTPLMMLLHSRWPQLPRPLSHTADVDMSIGAWHFTACSHAAGGRGIVHGGCWRTAQPYISKAGIIRCEQVSEFAAGFLQS